MSKVHRICGGVKQCKWSCRPPQGTRCCIQSWRDCQCIGVKSHRPRISAASLGTEMVGYTEPCCVSWSKMVTHTSAWCETSQGWLSGSGTCRACIVKAACECGTLRKVRDELH